MAEPTEAAPSLDATEPVVAPTTSMPRTMNAPEGQRQQHNSRHVQFNRQLNTLAFSSSPTDNSSPLKRASSRFRTRSVDSNVSTASVGSSQSSFTSVSSASSEVSPMDVEQKTGSGFGDFCVRNIDLASEGREAISAAEVNMPGLMLLRSRCANVHPGPLAGTKIVCCTHVIAPTAVVVETLVALGARIRWCTSNIYTTQDAVAAAVAKEGISVFAWEDQTEEEFWWCVEKAFHVEPDLILDDGGDATEKLLKEKRDLLGAVRGIVEESVAGVHRLYELSKEGFLRVPAMGIHDTVTKELILNRFVARDSIVDSLKNATNAMIAGKRICVCGFGPVGKGCAEALRAVGAIVTVTEIDPICAFQAVLQGYPVDTLANVVSRSDVIVTCTGNTDVVTRDMFDRMAHGTVILNMGHYDGEADIQSLYEGDLVSVEVHENLERICWPDGKAILLVARGRQANRCVTSGIPDLAYSVIGCAQVLSLMELYRAPPGRYKNEIYHLPKVLDEEIARLHVEPMGAQMTVMTPKQSKYIGRAVSGPFKSESAHYT